MYCRIAFTAFGVRLGFASSISATTPATTGDAMLVPVRLRYGCDAVATDPASNDPGWVRLKWLPALASETVPVPGATRSGFAPKSIYVGPREL